MAEYFTITISYKGTKRQLAVKLLPHEYSHKFQVSVGTTRLFFELDEEGEYRLIRMPWQTEKEFLKIDKEMIQEIVSSLKEIRI